MRLWVGFFLFAMGSQALAKDVKVGDTVYEVMSDGEGYFDVYPTKVLAVGKGEEIHVRGRLYGVRKLGSNNYVVIQKSLKIGAREYKVGDFVVDTKSLTGTPLPYAEGFTPGGGILVKGKGAYGRDRVIRYLGWEPQAESFRKYEGDEQVEVKAGDLVAFRKNTNGMRAHGPDNMGVLAVTRSGYVVAHTFDRNREEIVLPPGDYSRFSFDRDLRDGHTVLEVMPSHEARKGTWADKLNELGWQGREGVIRSVVADKSVIVFGSRTSIEKGRYKKLVNSYGKLIEGSRIISLYPNTNPYPVAKGFTEEGDAFLGTTPWSVNHTGQVLRPAGYRAPVESFDLKRNGRTYVVKPGSFVWDSNPTGRAWRVVAISADGYAVVEQADAYGRVTTKLFKPDEYFVSWRDEIEAEAHHAYGEDSTVHGAD